MGIAIDILFLIMVFFGFYFGFAFGLVKVAVYVVALLVALAAAMRFTPATETLIRDIFNTDSVYLPFLAFIVTLLALLGIARMVTKLLETTIDANKFNTISRVFGGIIMSATFIFLYSVLITFFSEARVIVKEEAQKNSFSYKYIQQIPDRGHVVLEMVAPFVQTFVTYMRNALQAIERRGRKSAHNLDDYHVDDSLYFDSLKRVYQVDDTSFQSSLSTDTVLTVTADRDSLPQK